MELIKIRELTKTYTTYERGSTFLDTVKSLFVRKKIYMEALRGFRWISVKEN